MTDAGWIEPVIPGPLIAIEAAPIVEASMFLLKVSVRE